ncbi:MAG: hypothetical protein A2Z96_02995 [Spirochaetes bacterium GWB1_48_6]|nr:MAG: hypothetical protein A2Z96_02995 [Spirochaetes bacterium GWB1_48_6]
MKNLVLAGMKHSGKSTLGKALAREKNLEFFDLDDLLVLEDPEKRSLSARQIYRDLGKEVFQSWEAKAAQKISTRPGPWVLALGGGSIQNPQVLETLKSQDLRVFLQEDSKILFERIMAGGLPAFLSPGNPWGDFQQIYAQRTALMEDWCHLKLPLHGADIPEALRLLTALLKENDHGW